MDGNRIQIEEIRNRIDIVNEISKYVQLKPAGKNFSGLCPFHNEKTPSFIVSPELQRYKCFGCGESGDIFTFIQNIENIDFPETLDKLAKEAGIILKKPKINTHLAKLYEINTLAARYFYKQLKKDKKALEYMKSRGFNDDSIFKFGVGYASGGYQLLDFLQKGSTKFNKKELLDSGLFTLKNDKLRSKFFKRIMFPIRSSSGKVLGFSGRILPEYDKGPKYMNTPGTPIFHKKENIFGQYESRKAIRKEDLVILCEGQTDVISAHQHGIENIVAPLGTALTIEQLTNLSKLTKNFLFLFDSDSAGQTAMQRAFKLISELNLQAYAASPEPFADIDEMLLENPKLLKTLIKKKTNLFSFLFSKKVENLDSRDYTDIATTLKWTKKLLSEVKLPSLRSSYVEELLNRNYFDSENIEGIRRDLLGTNTQYIQTQTKEKQKKSTNISRQEKLLCAILIPEEISIPKNFKLKYFTDSDVKKVLNHIKKEKEVTREQLLKGDFKEYVENAIFNFSQIDDKEEIDTLYNLIKKDYYITKEKELKSKIAIAETQGDTKKSIKLLQQFLKLTKENTNE
ncbi:DNA primase [bacterium]|nr:DNA primase [bacterium]